MKFMWHYDTPIGRLGIGETDGAISRILFEGQTDEGYESRETEVIKAAAQELYEYFAGERKIFDMPLVPEGTPFQKSCWNALMAIPYAETRSYKDIAGAVGNPKGFRAVGMANNRNPIPIVVPCHRVVGSDGSLIGFGGGLPTKQFLLDLEKENV